jgi:hypothetical protein
MGEFGFPDKVQEIVTKYIPSLQNLTLYELYTALYTKIAQDTLSFSNYWKGSIYIFCINVLILIIDPYQFQKYQSTVPYLSLYNNDSIVVQPQVSSFRDNFLRLKKAVFTASPDDRVIIPYFSALFSFWDTTDTQYTKPLVRLDMKNQRVFQSDLFGLKTMQQDGRLVLYDVPGVYHLDWLSHIDLFQKYVLPHLY